MEPGANQLAQLRRGVLGFCVLAVLRAGERYSFDLIRVLGQVDGLVTTEGTIYPLLARLRRTGLVDSVWRESVAGPPRRYYRLSTSGKEALVAFTEDWTRFRDGVDRLLEVGHE
jgi:PadR family transcriptional regulator PadR